MQAPARLLAVDIKDLDLVVTVPMREGDLYPIFVRNLTAFDAIAAVQLDFGLGNDIGKLTIEDLLQYRAVREAVRFPALINVRSNMSEADAYTLTTLGVQAVVLPASDSDDKTKKQVQATTAVVIISVFAFAAYFKVVDEIITRTVTRLYSVLAK